MNNNLNERPASGMNLADVYFVLFRHKWKILLCCTLGVLGSAAFYFLRPSLYQSVAILSVDYGLSSKSGRVPGEQRQPGQFSASAGEMLLNTEMEILRSYDVCRRVVTNIGATKILAKLGGGSDPDFAALALQAHLTVEHPKLSSLITISIDHPDPALVQPMLQALIDEYHKRNLEIHNDLPQLDAVMQERVAELGNRVAMARDALKRKRSESGVFSPDDETRELTALIGGTRKELNTAQADLAERIAIFHQIVGINLLTQTNPPPAAPVVNTNQPDKGTAAAPPVGTNATNTAAVTESATAMLEPPEAKLREFQTITNLSMANFVEREKLLGVFTPESSEVKKKTMLLEDLDRKRAALVKDFPKLEQPAPAAPGRAQVAAAYAPGNMVPTGPLFDTNREAGIIEGLRMRVGELQKQLLIHISTATNLNNVAGEMRRLEKDLATDEEVYKSYKLELQTIHTMQQIDNRDLSKIPTTESPTPPLKNSGKKLKLAAVILVAGVAAGFAWAFLIELVFDHSVKRVKDIEGQFGLQVLLTLPKVKQSTARQLADRSRLQLGAGEAGPAGSAGGGEGAGGAGGAVALPHQHAGLQTYYEALRDRLISYFDVRNLTHKPKLVAVTGAGSGVGTSTIAAGLAASLSETGEGNVLLVDMNPENGAAHQFFKGKLACELTEALDDGTRETGFIQKNLYVATGSANRDKLPRILPKRFANLLPKLKASDYDYIIFDMPAISQTSITPRLAGFMDIVLMVVESEKTDRDVAQRANAMLAESKANVKVVMNKTKRYVPVSLLPES